MRNPLIIIRAAPRSPRRSEASDAERHEAVADIDEETARLNRIVSDVLDDAVMELLGRYNWPGNVRVEREIIHKALDQAGSIKKDAAEIMGIGQRALSYYLAKYRLD